jgi:hypothetical protein
VFVAACWLSSANGFAGTNILQSLLQHSILDTNLPLTEVQAFCEARVLRMPKVKSAAEWDRIAERMRRDTLDKVIFRGEAKAWRDAKTQVEWQETIEGGPGYHIRKLRYEALPGLWIPALLYEPDKLAGKMPVMLAVNGHDSKGKAAPYKQIRCINMAKRGMIVLNVEWLFMGQLRTDGFLHYRMNQLDLCGTSGLAPFYLAMSRGLDLLMAHKHADPFRVAVSGLSGGGWQTIVISAFDKRVMLANPVAGYSSFLTRVRFLSDLGDSEQQPSDLATVTDYAHMTAMRAPRPTLLTYNAKDQCCFRADHALPPLLDAAQPIFALYDASRHLHSHINHDPGTHNFEKDNREAFYRMVGDFFCADDPNFNAQEIPSEAEVKTNSLLQVTMPKENLDFNKIALALSRNLPRQAWLPKQAARAKLRQIVHAKDYPVTTERVGSEERDDVRATYWKLKMGNDWTVPVVELARGEPKGTVILVSENGRKKLADDAERLLAEGRRVLAVDPFFFGESRIPQRDFLYALLVAAVGERSLGLQASQIAAVARWSHKQHRAPVTIVARGPRSSLFSLVAAALEDRAIAGATLHDSFRSLKEIITQNQAADKMPEMFCFGLLESFDVPQLISLCAPRTVKLKKETP